MLSKPLRIFLGIITAIILLAGSFSGGLLVGVALPTKTASALPLKEIFQLPQINADTSAAPTRETLFRPFWQAWDLVHQYFVEQPVNDQKLMQGAIRGMLASLDDPYSAYMDPEEYKQSTSDLQGEYEGIGAYVDIKGDYLSIIAPMPDSPAEKAGLKTGDIVIKVDGEDMTGIDGNVVLSKILGPAGTQVTLTIFRESEEQPFDVTITRAQIKVAMVETKMLPDNIAYLKLTSFSSDSDKQIHKALEELLAKNPAGLIFDLRYNTGGYLDAAINIISEFVPSGTIMYEEYSDGARKTFESRGGGIAYDIPMVVLVNEGSASASEITAGALQDLGRGKLVGVKTYGKGLVQNWTELMNDQGAVRITVAHWLTPNGRQINKEGLEPDVKVEITDDDIKAERDPQLDKAVELLK